MINIVEIENEIPKTITTDKLAISQWYPIHIGDIKGELKGFAQYLGGMSFVFIIGNNNPETGNREGLIGKLSLIGGVIIDKPARIEVELDAVAGVTDFRDVKLHGMFSVANVTYMRISEELAMADESGRITKFRSRTQVVPMKSDSNFAMTIKYLV